MAELLTKSTSVSFFISLTWFWSHQFSLIYVGYFAVILWVLFLDVSADVNADYVVDKSCKKEIVTQESAEHVKGYFVVIESIFLAR